MTAFASIIMALAGIILTIAIIILLLEDSTISQLNKIKKPCVVFAKHKQGQWYDKPAMVIKDNTGKLIQLNSGSGLSALIDKYNVGDTIK